MRPGEPVHAGEERPDAVNADAQAEPAAEAGNAIEAEPRPADTRGNGSRVKPMESMLTRLERRGIHVAENLDLDMSDPLNAVECEDRDDAVIKAFHALDADGARVLSTQQLRGLVALHTPEINKQQVRHRRRSCRPFPRLVTF